MRKHLLWQIPAGLCFILLTGVSFAANFQYGWAFGGSIVAAASVASDLFKVVGLIAFFAFLSMRLYLAAVASLVMFVGFTTLSLLSSVGFVSTHFAELSDTRGKTATEWQQLNSQISRLEERRAQIAATRPADAIQADIDRLLLTPGAENCSEINGPVTRQICPQVADLRVQHAAAKEADWLDGRLEALRADLGQSEKVSVIDPRIDSIIELTGLSAAAIALFMKLLFAGVVEFGTATGWWLVTRPFYHRPPEPLERAQEPQKGEPLPKGPKTKTSAPEAVQGGEKRTPALVIDNSAQDTRQDTSPKGIFYSWLANCTQPCSEGETAKNVHAAYSAYAKRLGSEPVGNKVFGRMMSEAGVNLTRETRDGAQTRLYKVRLKGGGLALLRAA